MAISNLQCGPVNRSPPPIVKSAENGHRDNVRKILKTNKGSANQQSCVRHNEHSIYVLVQYIIRYSFLSLYTERMAQLRTLGRHGLCTVTVKWYSNTGEHANKHQYSIVLSVVDGVWY